jgi:Prokaryotic phospholipase A2
MRNIAAKRGLEVAEPGGGRRNVMKGRFSAAAVAATVIAACFAGGSTAKVPPDDGGGSCKRACWAHAIIFKSSPPLQFYRHVKRHPKLKRRLDLEFENNGCSAPEWTEEIPLAGKYIREGKETFRRACMIHDFGYRNFGPGELKLQRFRMTQKQQDWGLPGAKANIDRRFLQQMYRICKSTDETGYFDACPRVARKFYWAVVHFGSI